jgi:hypothetical protein
MFGAGKVYALLKRNVLHVNLKPQKLQTLVSEARKRYIAMRLFAIL